MTEDELMLNILELSPMLGWEAAHFRPALTKRGWRTPVQGSMGKGFPDLILIRERDRRMIFAELKSDAGKIADHQGRVLDLLRSMVSVEPKTTWDQVTIPVSDGIAVLEDGSQVQTDSRVLTYPRKRIIPTVEVYVWRPKDWDGIVECLTNG